MQNMTHSTVAEWPSLLLRVPTRKDTQVLGRRSNKSLLTMKRVAAAELLNCYLQGGHLNIPGPQDLRLSCLAEAAGGLRAGKTSRVLLLGAAGEAPLLAGRSAVALAGPGLTVREEPADLEAPLMGGKGSDGSGRLALPLAAAAAAAQPCSLLRRCCCASWRCAGARTSCHSGSLTVSSSSCTMRTA